MKCFNCDAVYLPVHSYPSCARCGGMLDFEYDLNAVRRFVRTPDFRSKPVSQWKYLPFYPIKNPALLITLGEGNTPLIPSMKKKEVLFKFEGVNPTGSFKDRGSSIEITFAKEQGVKRVVCASTGNMGASIAAYAERAKMRATIFVPTFAPERKLREIKSYGANVRRVHGNYDDALCASYDAVLKAGKVFLTGDYPLRCEGQKSVAFEIAEQLQFRAPRNVVCPIGNGTLLYALFKGFNELACAGLIGKIPKLFGVQAAGCNPVENAWRNNTAWITPLKRTRTHASAINCGNPVYGLHALKAIRSTNGKCIALTDSELKASQKALAREGIHAELSGSAARGGALKLGLKGTTVVIVSGHGLKE